MTAQEPTLDELQTVRSILHRKFQIARCSIRKVALRAEIDKVDQQIRETMARLRQRVTTV